MSADLRIVGDNGVAHARDADLVARVRAGDVDAYETLVRRHRRAVYLVALAIANHVQDAEDICQDAFVQGFEHLASCRSPERFGAWIAQIARNMARNHRRTLRRHPAVAVDDVTPDSLAHTPDFGAHVDRARLRRRLLSALAQLSPTAREVVLLHELDDWRHATIAATLGISVPMSRRLLSDARRKLRQLLSDLAHQDRANG